VQNPLARFDDSSILIIGSVMMMNTTALTLADSTAHSVLAMPAELMADLPVPMALRLRVPGSPVPVCIWTGGAADLMSPLPVLADSIIFDGAELSMLVCATSADRLWRADFLGLCFEKWRQPEKRLELSELLAGANPDPSAQWSVERVLRRLGATLEAVQFDSVPVAHPLHAAA
jgi:hypothetical protein